MIDVMAVNLGGGGVHCISLHQPKSHKLSKIGRINYQGANKFVAVWKIHFVLILMNFWIKSELRQVF
jgi:hypothetical protein